jgi:hypothetical protein
LPIRPTGACADLETEALRVLQHFSPWTIGTNCSSVEKQFGGVPVLQDSDTRTVGFTGKEHFFLKFIFTTKHFFKVPISSENTYQWCTVKLRKIVLFYFYCASHLKRSIYTNNENYVARHPSLVVYIPLKIGGKNKDVRH